MAKEFVRNIKETKLRGKNIEPLYTNEQNDLLSDKKHAYIRNNDYYFPLTQAILDLASANDDGKNPVKPKLNIDGKENKATLEWDTKALGNNFVERTPITLTVDDEFNQIIIGIDQEALYRFIKPYFTSSKDITVDFNDKEQTIAYRLDDQAFFERLVSHFKDGNGLDFVIDNEFKTVHYNLKDDKIKSIIFDTVEAKDDDLAVEQKDDKLLIDLSEKNTNLLADHSANIEQHSSDIEILKETDKTHNENINTLFDFYRDTIEGINLIADKYDNQKVFKIILDQYIKDFDEEYPDNEIPSFYSLNILKEYLTGGSGTIKTSRIYLIFLVDTNNNTYVLKTNNDKDFDYIAPLKKKTKKEIDKYSRKLVNLKIKKQDNGYITDFNGDDLPGIIADLYTINNLEKI